MREWDETDKEKDPNEYLDAEDVEPNLEEMIATQKEKATEQI